MRMNQILFRLSVIILAFFTLYGFLYLPTIRRYLQPHRSINILVLPNLLDIEFIKSFEQKTGIKVYISYFENYEELIVKMKTVATDYDLVMASDSAFQILKEEGLVRKFDRKKLSFANNLYEPLRSLYCDPEGHYSIPYAWELYGIGIDKNFFDKSFPATWKLLFDTHLAPKRIGMLEDTREVIALAAFYLFGMDKHLNEHKIKEIEKLLLNQKERVVMYTDLRTDYVLLSQMAPVALGLSSDIYTAMKNFEYIDFVIPKEGTFAIVNLILLPKSTQKDEFIYAFLNYLFQPHIYQQYLDRYNFFSVLKTVLPTDLRFHLEATSKLFSLLHFFTYSIAEKQLREIWLTLKS